MKLALQFLTDSSGERRAVQLPLADWQLVMDKLNKYEQAFQLKSDLEEALAQVKQMRKSDRPAQTLTEFLDEL